MGLLIPGPEAGGGGTREVGRKPDTLALGLRVVVSETMFAADRGPCRTMYSPHWEEQTSSSRTASRPASRNSRSQSVTRNEAHWACIEKSCSLYVLSVSVATESSYKSEKIIQALNEGCSVINTYSFRSANAACTGCWDSWLSDGNIPARNLAACLSRFSPLVKIYVWERMTTHSRVPRVTHSV